MNGKESLNWIWRYNLYYFPTPNWCLLPWNQTCPPREGERTEEYCREENSIVSNILPIQCSYLIRPIASSMANTSASMVSCFCFSSTCSCTCIMYPLFFSCFVSFWVYENIFAAGSGGCAEQLGEDQAAIGVFLWPELAAGSLTQKIGNRSSSLRVSLFFNALINWMISWIYAALLYWL